MNLSKMSHITKVQLNKEMPGICRLKTKALSKGDCCNPSALVQEEET